MIQVGDDASFGGYLVEGVQAGARQVGAAGVLLLDNHTTSWWRHRHLWAHFQSANESLAIALTVKALLHAGHYRFVSIPSAVMMTAYSKGRDEREYGEYVIESGRMVRFLLLSLMTVKVEDYSCPHKFRSADLFSIFTQG